MSDNEKKFHMQNVKLIFIRIFILNFFYIRKRFFNYNRTINRWDHKEI